MNNLKLNISFVLSILCVIAIAYMFFRPAAQKEKIAFVDINRLMKEYAGIIKAKDDYQKQVEMLNVEADSLFKNWQDDLREFERRKSTYSLTEKELEIEKIQAKEKRIGKMQNANKKHFEQIFDKTVTKAYDQAIAFVSDYGRKNSYLCILGKNGPENILYGNPSQDLTELMIKELNTAYSGN